MVLVKHTASGSTRQRARTRQPTKASQEERARPLEEELLPVMQCVCVSFYCSLQAFTLLLLC